MSITLTLEPETERRAVAQAASRGVPLEDFLEAFLEQSLPSPHEERALTAEEMDAFLDEFALGCEDETPPIAITREDIYADHD